MWLERNKIVSWKPSSSHEFCTNYFSGPATIIYDEQGHRANFGTARISEDGSETARSSSSKSGTTTPTAKSTSDSSSSHETHVEKFLHDMKSGPGSDGGKTAVSAPAMSEKSSTSSYKSGSVKSVSSTKQRSSKVSSSEGDNEELIFSLIS